MPGGSILRRPFFPNLICVEIAELSIVQSKVNPVWGSATPQKRRRNKRLYRCQINLGSKRQDRKFRTEKGDRTFTRGHLVFRTMDLAPNTALPKPKKGDQITRIYVDTDQVQDVDWLVEEVRYESPLKGRPLLMYVEFERNREKTPDFDDCGT